MGRGRPQTLPRVTIKCEYCGKRHKTKWRTGRPKPRFCSPACWQKSKKGTPEAARNARHAASFKSRQEVGIKPYKGGPRAFVYDETGKRRLRYRVAIEKKLGRRLKSSEIVHHIDEDSLNDKIDNLQLVTRSKHAKIHNFGRKGVIR